MVSCFAPGCKSGYGKGSRDHMFKPSNLTAAKWIAVLWKLRSDKKFDPNIQSHKLCSRHFQDNDIIKEDKFKIDNEEVALPRTYWTLKKDAVPTIFPDIPNYLQPKVPKPRRELKRKCVGEPLPPNKRKRAPLQYGDITPNDFSQFGDLLTPPATSQAKTGSEKAPLDLTTTRIDRQSCNLPLDLTTGGTPWWKTFNPFKLGGSWMIESEHSEMFVSILEIMYNAGIPNISRTVSVSRTTGEWKSAINSKDITSLLCSQACLPKQINSKEDASAVIYQLKEVFLCQGISGFNKINCCGVAHRKEDKWFSVQCKQLDRSKVCQKCKLLYPVLQRKSYRLENRALRLKNSETVENCKIGYLKRRLNAYKKSRNTDKKKIRGLRFSLMKKEKEKVLKMLDKMNLPENNKRGILQSLQLAKRKSSKGFRYSTDWLLECLLLKIKSPAAYHHLREAKILPLPHPSTLRKLISGQKCDFGYNEISFKAIQEEFKNLSRRDRQGVLVFDELQLRESIEFNKREMKFVGYVDFSSEHNESLSPTDKGRLANHALVLMYRPFNSSWVQPIGVFATRNAAKGNMLQKLILSAVLKLEEIGAEVLCVTCDGSKPNKSFWKLMGISGYSPEITNKIPHPADPARYLHFASDVPHLFKCSRNNFLKYDLISFQGKDTKFDYYRRLLEAEQRRSCGLRKCPKLSMSHIRPNNFEKMIVSHATQLFSRSVATGLNFYRSMGYSDFYGSEATEAFTQLLNDVFDCLNARSRAQGVTPSSKQYETLTAFLRTLAVEITQCDDKEGPKTFASKETIAALRVTIASTLDIIKYLVIELNYEYVLTAKMNQDCLEKFFGLIRAAGGREDHPTINNFIQLYRLLTIYTPVKRAIRGNISDEEEVTVLCKFNNYLETSRKAKDAEVTLKRQIHYDTIYERLLNLDQTVSMDLEECLMDDTDKNLVYHLCGFLCHKAKKLVKCDECVKSIISSRCDDRIATMTNIMNLGSLHYPSEAFVKVILCGVEEKIGQFLKDSYLYGDIILECIKCIGNVNTSEIGCKIEGHSFEMLSIMIPYYITMRINFYARSINSDIGRGKSTKNKRKESKLIS